MGKTESVAGESQVRRSHRPFEAMQLQRLDPLDGSSNGVSVRFAGRGSYLVKFARNPLLVAEMAGVGGAMVLSGQDVQHWRVPVTSYEALAHAVSRMRAEYLYDVVSRADIERLASHHSQPASLINLQESSFAPTEYSGRIVCMNDRYAAQFTEGRNGGGAVHLHHLYDLDDALSVGDYVDIRYARGRGHVRQALNLEERFDMSLGSSIDGVKVVQEGNQYTISFDPNPALYERIQRVDGVAFDSAKQAHVAPADRKRLLAQAVKDMRAEYVADRRDRDQLLSVANERVSCATVSDASSSDGKTYVGQVLAVNSRYVLHHNGRDHVVLHRTKKLDRPPEIGRGAKVTYREGRGHVAEGRGREQYTSHSR